MDTLHADVQHIRAGEGKRYSQPHDTDRNPVRRVIVYRLFDVADEIALSSVREVRAEARAQVVNQRARRGCHHRPGPGTGHAVA